MSGHAPHPRETRGGTPERRSGATNASNDSTKHATKKILEIIATCKAFALVCRVISLCQRVIDNCEHKKMARFK